ncbi:MAG: hypothetical protein K0S76_86 [Herbinix sp.]|nr:hypothetical protein [Herbinix sp.]
MYFLSFEPGYYPFNLSFDEVQRMTEYMNDLERALKYYVEAGIAVSFDNGNINKNKKTWSFGEKPLPFTAFQFGNLIISDDELLQELANVPKGKMYLEVDISPMGVSVGDKKYDRPANPVMCLIADAKSEMIIKCEMKEPGTDPIVELAEEIVGFIFAYGAPKEIQVTNVIVESGLEQICDVCKIKLRRVKKLKALEYFKTGMKRYM